MTSKNGAAPFSPSDVDPNKFGSGGANIAPNQGVPAMGRVLNDLLGRVASPVANVTALQATLAADRVDGQTVLTLDTYTFWVWKATDATAADANHIAPTDLAGGAGRFVNLAVSSGSGQGQVQHVVIDIPLATIQAKTSGAAFNIGAALPANARLIRVETDVIVALTGTGPMSAAHSTIQNTGEAAGALQASTDVFTGTGFFALIGSNPYPSRGTQQLQMTITTIGGTLAAALTGHLAVGLYYTVDP
jgi:hypothetical protein